MAIKIKNTKNVAANGANIVIYGDAGVGKTTLTSHLTNAFILSADQGLLSLASKNIEYMEIKNMFDIEDAYLKIKKGDYDHVVFDSLTEMAESVLYELKDNKEIKDPRQAYGILADAFGVMIRKFRDIKGVNVIFLAKMKKNTDEEDYVLGYEPMMPGKVLPHGLPYLTDEVFAYLIDRNGKRYFQTHSTRKHVAKDRSGKLDAVEMEPNLNDIINKLLSRKVAKPKPVEKRPIRKYVKKRRAK